MQKYSFLNIFIIFVVSIVTNYYYGSLGVFPIDTFAFFDSANSINKNFLPIRDYWTSNGLLVDLIQSIFFKLFGVSWHSYLLHSSLLNFLLAYFSYKFFTSEGLKKAPSLFYSLSIAILAYPSVGVPFSDHHSLIFSIVGVYSYIISIKKKSNFFLFLTIFLLGIAFLCKQVPAAFFIFLISFHLVFFSILNKNYFLIINSFLITLSFLFGLIIFLEFNDVGIKNFFIQYIFFPLSIGSERSGDLSINIFVLSFFKEFKFFFILSLVMLYQIIKQKNVIQLTEKSKIYNTNIIFLFVILISIINQLIMKNQNMVFFLLPILIGIIHSHVKLNKKNFKKIILVFFIFNIFITFKYHDRFNIDRKFMDLQNINKLNFEQGAYISDKLKGLKWVTAVNQEIFKNEVELIKKSLEYLRVNKKNSVIITYYQFINSELDHNLYSPNRWYTDDGISYPLKDNKYHDYYVEFFKSKLKEKKIEKIYTIYPLDEKAFSFVFKNNCYDTIKINDMLLKHNILNCFAKLK